MRPADTQAAKAVGRPKVHVSALTANSCEVMVFTDEGEVRLICRQDSIEVQSKGLKVEVAP